MSVTGCDDADREGWELMKKDDKDHSPAETVRIPAQALKKGMYVSGIDRPWEETPFLFQGFIIENDGDLRTLQEYCDHVTVDIRQSKHLREGDRTRHHEESIATGRVAAATKGKMAVEEALHHFGPPPKRSRTLANELHPAIETYEQANRLVKSTMEGIRLGRSVDTQSAKAAVAGCVDSIIRNPEAMLLLSRLKTREHYTSEHSLNVSILSIAFGRHLGMDRRQLNEIGLCGMLHDMGKMMAPDEVLNKPGRLEGEEIEIMKRHPLDGRNILMSSSGLSHAAIDAAYGHHERSDGSGYPEGVRSDRISLYTKIVSIVDVFDAVTSDRAYRDGATTSEALNLLHAKRGEHYDPSLVLKFTECIGAYPVGTVVELHNGEIGLVVQVHPTARLKPRIRLFLDEQGKPRDPMLIDLAAGALDARGVEYRIKTAHHPRKFNLDLRRCILGPSAG